MVNKITFWNLITLILIVFVSIFGMYFINYPMKFNFSETIKDIEWESLFFLFLASIILSLIFAIIPFKDSSYGNRFQKILLFLSILVLMYALYFTFSTYFKNKLEMKMIENKYIERAKKDIKNDNVIFQYSGGFTLPEYDEKMYSEIDSIRKNYGITYDNTGCIVDFKLIAAEEKYENIVKPYLEKRNGKNWEAKMNAEIKNISRNK